MLDIVNGKVRARKWPTKRPGPKSPEQQKRNDLFTQAQKSYKYGAPAALQFAIEATTGTPMLPRDFWTQLIFQRIGVIVMQNGRTLYPMVARNSVEAGLDTISQTVGDVLVKTESGWAGIPAGAGGGVELLEVRQITVPVTDVDFTDLSNHGLLALVCLGLTNAMTSRPVIRLSDNGGISYFDNTADYNSLTSTGGTNLGSGMFARNTDTSGPQDWVFFVGPNTDHGKTPGYFPQFPYTWICKAISGRFDALRITPSRGSWTAGTIALIKLA